MHYSGLVKKNGHARTDYSIVVEDLDEFLPPQLLEKVLVLVLMLTFVFLELIYEVDGGLKHICRRFLNLSSFDCVDVWSV